MTETVISPEDLDPDTPTGDDGDDRDNDLPHDLEQ